MPNSTMTPIQIVNMFCNMTGVAMNESQKEALLRLLEEMYKAGFKSSHSENVESSKGVSSMEGPAKQCDGCKTLGPDMNLQVSDLPRFGGKGTYCWQCRSNYIAREKSC